MRREADVLIVEGPVTLQTVTALLAEAGPHLESGVNAVDFGAAADVDSSAVALALEWQRQASGRGVTLQLQNLPEAMLNLARLYGVAELMQIAQA